MDKTFWTLFLHYSDARETKIKRIKQDLEYLMVFADKTYDSKDETNNSNPSPNLPEP